MNAKWVEFTTIYGKKVSVKLDNIDSFLSCKIPSDSRDKSLILKPEELFTRVNTVQSYFDVTATYDEVKQVIEEN